MLKNIGMIGDSISHGYYDEKDLGWFARLGKIILNNPKDTYLFNNMSQSGDNIADTANRISSDVLSRNFDLILVNTGINDLRRRKNSNMQLDFSEGARIMYWNKLLDSLALTKAKIVVLDLIPVVESRYTKNASLVRNNSDVIRYNQLIKEICEQRNINFFARYHKWENRNLEDLYKDATHPNSKGHQLIAEEVYEYLEKNNLL